MPGKPHLKNEREPRGKDAAVKMTEHIVRFVAPPAPVIPVASALSLRSSSLPSLANATLPEMYRRAKSALAQCAALDECQAWADKGKALASYAKQADDQTLHQLATRISARAIRRAGDLLEELDGRGAIPKSGGAPTFTRPSRQEAATAAGMSKDQAVTAVRVARVPAAEFEALVESETPPTITALAELGTVSKTVKVPAGFAHATEAIGTLKQFAEFCQEHPAALVAGGVYDYEVAGLRVDLALVQEWLAVFDAFLNRQS